MAKTRGPSAKAYYAAYKSQGTFAKNRRKKLERTLKAQPNNLQVAQALKNIASYRRKTPNVSTWSTTRRDTAKLFKEFTGMMNINVFNTNQDVKVLAISSLKNKVIYKTHSKVTNRLVDRAHDKQGNLVWA